MTRLVHITDPHLAPLPPFRLREFSVKRFLGYLNWHKKRKHQHRKNVLDALVRDIQGLCADHIAIAGDLTNLALNEEYKNAQKWVQNLGIEASVIPGNHDAHRSDFEKFWAQHFEDSRFPFVKKIGPMALIGLNSAYPTAPFIASGRLCKRQLAELSEELHILKDQGLCRIILIHHPVHENATKRRRMLLDDEGFRGVVETRGAELILHGHEHKPVSEFIAGPDQPVAVRGAGSCSYIDGGHYHVIDVEDQNDRWNIVIGHRFYNAQNHAFEEQHSETLTINKAA